MCSAIHPLVARLAVPVVAAARRARPRRACTPSCRWPTRSTAAGRSRCTAPWPRRRTASAPTGPPTERLIGPLVRDWEELVGRPARPAASAAAPPAPRRAVRRARPALGVGPRPPRFGDDAGPRAPRGERRPLDAPAHRAGDRARSRCSSSCSATPSAGRSRRAGRRRSPTRWRRSSARSAARSRPGRPVHVARRAPAGAGGAVRRHAARDPSRSPATRCPGATGAALARFRYGPGVFKLDYALDGPVPWAAAECRAAPARCTSAARSRSSAASEAEVGARRARRRGRTSWSPSRASSTRARAPAGAHTLWAYCHVPNGSDADMTEAIEAQIERFAPGFRDVVRRAQHDGAGRASRRTTRTTSAATSTAALADLRQLLARPALRPVPYATPEPAPLHLLVLDASRRRRARHVRLARRARGAPGRAAVR